MEKKYKISIILVIAGIIIIPVIAVIAILGLIQIANVNEENKITGFHFYKYPKEYRKKYGYKDEWTSEDLM